MRVWCSEHHFSLHGTGPKVKGMPQFKSDETLLQGAYASHRNNFLNSNSAQINTIAYVMQIQITPAIKFQAL